LYGFIIKLPNRLLAPIPITNRAILTSANHGQHNKYTFYMIGV
jgi:hypothetical protein